MSTMIPRGNLSRLSVITVVLSPASVAANTTAEQTFTVPLRAGDMIFDITKPTNQPGLGVVNTRISAANTVAITFINATAGAIVPTAGETYLLLLGRADSTTGVFI